MSFIRIGIDGCKSGWFALGLTQDLEVFTEVYPHIQEVVWALPQAQQILIDIPIGLPYHEKRLCDFAARKVLSPYRSSSVFPVPSRKSLYAASYEEACEVNLQLMGNKLSKQSWNIGNKITEVDTFLRNNPPAQKLIRECHPEVAFWNFNQKSAMPHSKKTAEGQADRLSIISRHIPEAEAHLKDALDKWPRRILAKDDILDAMILAVSASYPLLSLPEKPLMDLEGLPMEIVYADLG